MTELWVATDRCGTWLFRSEPAQNERDMWHSREGEPFGSIPSHWLNLKSGECRRLVLEKEKSE